jgi:hypothetical protein
MSPSHTWRAVATAFVLCLGLLALAPAGTGAAASDPVLVPTATTVTGSNPGVGALRLSAVASSELQSYSTGVMVFEIDGRKPVTVPLGRYVIAGRKGDLSAPDDYTAVADFTGLHPQGTYHATATYLPDEGSGADGSGSEVTTTLTRRVDKSTLTFNPNARGRAVELLFSVQAYPPNAVVGTVVVRDRTQGGVVVSQHRHVRAGQAGFATIRNVSRGVHRYRARFIPLPRLADTLRGSVVTVDLAVGR